MAGRIMLLELECIGTGQPNASIAFKSGLNIVAGASNTGKTYIFRLLDFLLGSSSPPPTIPEAQDYQQAVLRIATSTRGVCSLTRALVGGDVRLDVEMPTAASTVEPRVLRAKHVTGDSTTLSAFLVDQIGLSGLTVRRNERGEKSSLTFRDVAWLTLIDEQRIIGTGSPVLSGQYTEPTKERGVFGYFLTGRDDAAIQVTERPKDRRARLEAEAAAIRSIIEDRERREVAVTASLTDLKSQLERTDSAISEASDIISSTQVQISAAEARRAAAWQQLQVARSRRLFVGEQLTRLTLLAAQYQSDVNRLDAMVEAGGLYAELPAGTCPVCGSASGFDAEPSDDLLRAHQLACASERKKIAILQADLNQAMTSLELEAVQLDEEQVNLSERIRAADENVQALLIPRSLSTGVKLDALLAQRDRLQRAIVWEEELIDLRDRLGRVVAALQARVAKAPKLPPKVETQTTVRFCEVVRSLLDEWRYPGLKTVTFDVGRFDLVINDQNRGDMGKGYRAFTHAAFTIGLMRYCREAKIPHPGTVILDTPLNPLRGPDDGAEGRINDEIKQAFFRSLATDTSGDQVIILENTEPPADVRKQVTYHHFSANVDAGRYGFFPKR